jgi:hypothetical protein
MGMSGAEKKGPTLSAEGRLQQDERADRLSRALRENLRRRKAQQRARGVPPGDETRRLEPTGEDPGA